MHSTSCTGCRVPNRDVRIRAFSVRGNDRAEHQDFGPHSMNVLSWLRFVAAVFCKARDTIFQRHMATWRWMDRSKEGGSIAFSQTGFISCRSSIHHRSSHMTRYCFSPTFSARQQSSTSAKAMTDTVADLSGRGHENPEILNYKARALEASAAIIRLASTLRELPFSKVSIGPEIGSHSLISHS
jgi:hypothetical protein